MPTCSVHPNRSCSCVSVEQVIAASENAPPCINCLTNLQECTRCYNCDNCCTARGNCFTCESCEEINFVGDCCTSCQKCFSCCECYTCSDCGNGFDIVDFCTICDHCTDCCCCDGPEHCPLIESTDRFWDAKRNEKRTNPSGRYCAVEIEVAYLEEELKNNQIVEACSNWGAGIVHDGSLPETGFEINTAPAAGDKYIVQISEICNALSICKAKVNKTCGLHVHVDARDFGYWEIRRLIILYAKIEEALFAIVPSSRQTNNYCVKCGDRFLKAIRSGSLKKVKAAVCKAVYNREDIKGKRTNKYDDSRYTALNLHSWFYRGTVECRLFSGTTNVTKIQNWGMLWAGILDWIYKSQFKELTYFDNKSSLEVLLSVCPTDRIRTWVKARHDSLMSSEDYYS